MREGLRPSEEETIQASRHLIGELIRQDPKLGEFQAEINSYLEKAGSCRNRIDIIEFLMEVRLVELCKNLAEIRGLLRRIGM